MGRSTYPLEFLWGLKIGYLSLEDANSVKRTVRRTNQTAISLMIQKNKTCLNLLFLKLSSLGYEDDPKPSNLACLGFTSPGR